MKQLLTRLSRATRTGAWRGWWQRKHDDTGRRRWQSRIDSLPIPGTLKWPIKLILFPLLHPQIRIALVAILFGLTIALMVLIQDLPSPRRLTSKENYAVSTQIFDRRGILLYEIFAEENRTPISLKELPPHVYQASVAIEDQRFYHHWGVDFIGITRAALNNLRGEPVEGASTITQQLVKNALLTREKTWQRKGKEAVLALITEVIYSKEDILEMYLNYISYGGTAVGIEAASQQYFDKPAKELSLAEAALLAGLPQAPSKYSPFGSDPERAKARQADVLRRMAEDGYITQEQATQAKQEVLKYALSKTDIKAPHFVFYVRDWLYKQYGVETVEKGGLRVTTTLDLELQEAAQASLSAEVAKLQRLNVGNGSAMITKPVTGEILAMIGSKDYFDEEGDGQVNVSLAFRQPGSSIKPLMYGLAFQNKLLNPGTILLDIPTCFKVLGQKPYCPKNYDGSYKGPVTIRQSLGNSLNIPAVKGLQIIGLTRFIEQARSLGITTWVDPSKYGLSLTLGGGEVRMIDMAQVFGTIANQGVKVPLTPILKIEDYQGNVLQDIDPEQRRSIVSEMNLYEDETEIEGIQRVMDRAPAYLTAHIMQDNNARLAAFGPRSELVIPNQIVSAKTGTTNDVKDNWTVGFTPEFLVITWVGNNDGSPMNSYLVSGVTGAAPIWNDIMSFLLRDQAPIIPSKPGSVLSAGVCANGMPPQNGNKCNVRYQELYWANSTPSASLEYTKEIWVKSDTGTPPAPGEQADNLVLETHIVISDPTTPYYCLDCRTTVTEEGKTVYQPQTVPDDYQPTQTPQL